MDDNRRFALLREVVDKLATGSWADANLVLGQFGLPVAWPDQWESVDLRRYLVRTITGVGDDLLERVYAAVAEYQAPAPEGAATWLAGNLRLFGSYLVSERHFVGDVRAALGRFGIDLFAAHDSIAVSRQWAQVIEDALRSCDAAVIFLHAGFRDSEWTDQESGFCVARRVPILPLMFTDDTPHGFLSPYQGLRCHGLSRPAVAERITDWLVDDRRARRPITEALVTALEMSGGFERTRTVLSRLMRLDGFTPAQLQRMEHAAQVNRQVAEAFLGPEPAPEVIRRIVADASAPPG